MPLTTAPPLLIAPLLAPGHRAALRAARLPLLLLAALMLSVLLGCSSVPNKAPIEDRKPAKPVVKAPAAQVGPVASTDSASPAGAMADTAKGLSGADNAGKPGYYTVKPGDTLMRIALDNGQNWRDVVRWNSQDNPNLIEVGQVLRVVTPSADASAVASRGVAAPKIEARPLDGKPAPGAAASAGAAALPGAAASAPVPVRESDDNIGWGWPASGTVLAGFEEGRQKGLAIAGKAGDPVLAAADGRVVYVGAELRGYGNLVIVKHNNTYLTAYAHNQAVLVKEDQAVRRGQKIAEMGSSDAERVQLHFEIRRQGKPIDPARLLPAR